MAILVSLEQHGSAEQFHDPFVSLLNQLQLLESYDLIIFTNNLKLEIGQYLQLFKPKSLSKGFLIARQVERILLNSYKRSLFTSFGNPSRPLTVPPTSPSLVKSVPTASPILVASSSQPTSKNAKVSNKELSLAEITERKWKGLCFWCGAKYIIGLRCVKSQLYKLLLELHSDGEGEEFQECQEQLKDLLLEESLPQSPILFLHAF
ncbi:hypothetical protein J1N35_009701 [Gossypium stocksii]|uniref:Uncharacterized protein n=1 Tax=Gossypium stocksii TaxID=47602 RepID=A0A9D3W115_9ROSI|nr:hypothetical protein J1N35_009701 [Gossypium stocksii]